MDIAVWWVELSYWAKTLGVFVVFVVFAAVPVGALLVGRVVLGWIVVKARLLGELIRALKLEDGE